MLKRRDWGLLHGRDGSGSDISSDDEAESSGQGDDDSASQSDISQESSRGDDSGDDDGQAIGRLEDISEDEFETRDLDRDASALKRSWLNGETEDSTAEVKGPLACRLCKGVLILGPASLKQHLSSKRHLGRQKKKQQDYEPICLAKQIKDDGLETHQERLERLRKATETTGQQGEPVKSKRAVRRALLKARKQAAQQADAKKLEGSTKPRKGSKPGKRQRAEQKQAVQEGGTKQPKKRRKTNSLENGIADLEPYKPGKMVKAFRPKQASPVDKQSKAPSKANRKERRSVKFERVKSAKQKALATQKE